MGERARREKRWCILCHIVISGTNPSIKPLTTDRFENFIYLASSEFFCRHYIEKTSPISLTVFFDKATQKLHTQTDRQTHTHSEIIIEISRGMVDHLGQRQLKIAWTLYLLMICRALIDVIQDGCFSTNCDYFCIESFTIVCAYVECTVPETHVKINRYN